mmetsp:Transcript_32845/g.86748  ORF Transcript_32845/g.86748 Transcript_32845/m.86748 type:complete len:276 (-) Transcript_32845:819-1646(-)
MTWMRFPMSLPRPLAKLMASPMNFSSLTILSSRSSMWPPTSATRAPPTPAPYLASPSSGSGIGVGSPSASGSSSRSAWYVMIFSCSFSSSRSAASDQFSLWMWMETHPIRRMALDTVMPFVAWISRRARVCSSSSSACFFVSPSMFSRSVSRSTFPFMSSTLARIWFMLRDTPSLLPNWSVNISSACCQMAGLSSTSPFTAVYLSMTMAMSMLSSTSTASTMKDQNHSPATMACSFLSTSQSKFPKRIRKQYGIAFVNVLNSQTRRPKRNIPETT